MRTYCIAQRALLHACSDKEAAYVYTLLIHFAVQQKLTPHCKTTKCQFKKKKKKNPWTSVGLETRYVILIKRQWVQSQSGFWPSSSPNPSCTVSSPVFEISPVLPASQGLKDSRPIGPPCAMAQVVTAFLDIWSPLNRGTYTVSVPCSSLFSSPGPKAGKSIPSFLRRLSKLSEPVPWWIHYCPPSAPLT